MGLTQGPIRAEALTVRRHAMASMPHDHESVQTPTGILWTRLVFTYLFMLLALWIPAWDVGWWQAWAYSVVFLVAGIGGRLWAELRHPGLLAERQSLEQVQDALRDGLKRGESPSSLARTVAVQSGWKRRETYRIVTEIDKQ